MAAQKKKAKERSTESSPESWAKTVARARQNINKGIKKLGGAQMSAAEMKKLAELHFPSGPSVTVTKLKGRNPHVGRNIPRTSNKEVVKRRRAARKKKAGKVRAVNRRK